MVTPASNLVAIHNAIVPVVAAALPAGGADHVQYVQDVIGPLPPSTDTVARVLFIPPRRQWLGHESVPTIQQVGRLEVHWLFPTEARWLAIQTAITATQEAFRERTLSGGGPTGVRMHGDALVDRESDVQGRTFYRVTTEWETLNEEPSAGDMRAQLTTVTDAEAMRAVRDVWAQRIEAAISGESWDGVPTQWDQQPDTVPAMPWAAYFVGGFFVSTQEIGGKHEIVDGRALVTLHTSPQAGAVPTLTMLERIIAEHNCATRQVRIGPASIEGQQLSFAATLQTNIRLPFTYERTKP